MRSRELSADRETGLWQDGYGENSKNSKKISAALKVPRSTAPSIILKWKRFGYTNSFPKFGHPHKLRAWSGTKCLGQADNQEPNDQYEWDPRIFCGVERTIQMDNQLCRTPPIRPLCASGQTEAVFTKRHVTAHWEFANQTLRTLRLWKAKFSDKTKIELFDN